MSAPSPDAAYDVVVIGAGVNGAAIARDAALRGLRVALVDKDDVGSGTSAWSSRLIHGGIRYLEHGELRLVRESLREREILLRSAPHLVSPFGLLIPFYEHNHRSAPLLSAGMAIYDLLSADKSTPWHRLIGWQGVRERWPGLQIDGLKGGALYHDAQARYAERLSVENALSAREAGASLRLYTQVVGLLREGARVRGVRLRDRAGSEMSLAASVVVNAAGPWADQVLAAGEVPGRLIGGTKGSHLVVERFAGAPSTGVHYEAKSDNRAVLVLPWNGRYLIGSTDLYYDGNPGDAVASDAEVDYLLSETNALIPSAQLTPADVLYSYAGIRALPYTPHAAGTADVSRDHHVVDHSPQCIGLFSIVGGKLTTHRALGELAVDKVVRHLGIRKRRCATRRLPLPGGRSADFARLSRRLRTESRHSATTMNHLLAVYGARAAAVLALAAEDPRLAEVLPGEDEALAAEIVFAFQHEFATTLTDVLQRRSMVGLDGSVGLDTAEAAAAVAAAFLAWSDQRVTEELAAHRTYLQRLRPRALRGPTAVTGDTPAGER